MAHPCHHAVNACPINIQIEYSHYTTKFLFVKQNVRSTLSFQVFQGVHLLAPDQDFKVYMGA